MTLFVDPIEGLWVVTTTTTLVLTLYALFEAIRSLRLARLDASSSHEARETVAAGNVRREALRAVVQSLLLSIAIPGLFIDRPITLTAPLLALILVPLVLFTSTVFDARDRGRLAVMLVNLVRVERESLALESSVQTNIELTKQAAEHADAAYQEANTVNQKIARLTALVAGKEDKA